MTDRSKKQFRSCAEWPADVYTASDGSHVSYDDHYTEGEAGAVADRLAVVGFGGNGRRPIRTWVEPLSDA